MKLFIYGTLKRGHSRAGVLSGQRFLGEVYTQARYRLYDTGSYPALVEVALSDGVRGREIQGELWQVDAACLATLDKIEGVPRLFRRLPVELKPLEGNEETVVPVTDGDVEAYFYQHAVAGLRDCGDCWASC